jgi:hypothetical protein
LNSTFVVYFTGTDDPTPTVGGGSAAIGLNPWEGASDDQEWQEEQNSFLDLVAQADLEALDTDP